MIPVPAARDKRRRLVSYTLPGYGTSVKHAEHTKQLTALRRIEGQLRGVIRMVEDKRYCVDILTQIRAVQAALRRVESRILREHIEHCVVAAIRHGRQRDQREKIDELLDVVTRFGG